MSQTIDQVFRDYKTQGVPASGEHEPDKREIRALLKMIQNSGGQAVTRNTLSALNGVTPPTENYMGVVLADPTASNNGYYYRSGGAWVFGRPFPDTFAEVALSGSGTAQTGAVDTGVNPSGVEVFFARVTTPNTGPLTLSISGGPAREVVNLAGNPLSAGEWTGMVMFFLNEGGQYQLLLDAGAAQAAAASATFADERADDADAAAVRAENAAASFSEIGTNFKTVANLLADTTVGYSGSGADTEVDAGDIITAQGFRYEVAASDATDAHVETAGGVKLYVRTLHVQAFGVGIGLGDDAPAMLTALTAADGAQLDCRNTVPVFNSELAYDGPVNLIGPSTINLSGGGSIRWRIEPETLPDLAADILGGRSSVSFASAHGLASGDVIVAHNPADYSFAPYRAYYNDGCMFEIDQISSSTAATFFGVSPDTYLAADMDMYRLVGGGVSLRDIHFMPNTAEAVNVWIDGHPKVRLHDVTFEGSAADTGIEIYRCYDVLIKDTSAEALVGSGAYPIILSNSQKIVCGGISNKSTRHALAFGGRDGAAAVPYRDVLVHDTTLVNRASGGIGSADMHGNGANITFDNCILNTGANMAGLDVAYRNCTIYGRDVGAYADGICLYGDEVVGGTFTIENCKFVTWGPGSSSFGILTLGVQGRTRDFMLIARNNTIEQRGAGTSARLIMVVIGDAADTNTKRIDTVIDGLVYKAPVAPLIICSLSGFKNAPSQMSAVVDNVTAPGGQLLAASEPANYAMPLRLQRQSGAVTTSCASGSSTANSGVITYKYSYPRAPVPSVTHAPVGTGTAAAFGGKRVQSAAFQCSATTIRVTTQTSDGTTFSSTEDVRQSWSVGIDEV